MAHLKVVLAQSRQRNKELREQKAEVERLQKELKDLDFQEVQLKDEIKMKGWKKANERSTRSRRWFHREQEPTCWSANNQTFLFTFFQLNTQRQYIAHWQYIHIFTFTNFFFIPRDLTTCSNIDIANSSLFFSCVRRTNWITFIEYRIFSNKLSTAFYFHVLNFIPQTKFDIWISSGLNFSFESPKSWIVNSEKN